MVEDASSRASRVAPEDRPRRMPPLAGLVRPPNDVYSQARPSRCRRHALIQHFTHTIAPNPPTAGGETPPNPTMVLGRLAHARFGISYVIDYIDPVVSDYYWKLPRSQRPPKYAMAYALARLME